jgi:hypothetical protein
MKELLFYGKCRPQGCDAWPVAQEHGRVFVGYPVHAGHEGNADWRTMGCRRFFRDLRDPAWSPGWSSGLDRGYRAQVTFNGRLAREIGPGSRVLVPRPGEGVCHVGEVTGPFELVDQPAWADEYLRLRAKHALRAEPQADHVGDIVQTWPVRWDPTVPFTAIPRWISFRLLSRNTIGVIEDLQEPAISALDAIRDLVSAPARHGPPLTGDPQLDLVNWLAPASFEHLVISLLQLESADMHWHHVGGSGDGGVDGIGVDAHGALRGVVQCKWHWSEDPGQLFRQMPDAPVRVAAILLGAQESSLPLGHADRVWNRRTITGLVRKHAHRLPLARALGLTS